MSVVLREKTETALKAAWASKKKSPEELVLERRNTFNSGRLKS
jgi:hypothetical protein